MWLKKRAWLMGCLLAVWLCLPARLALADGGPYTDDQEVWRQLEEGQQVAVVRLDQDSAHTDLFVSILDGSGHSHAFTFFVPLGAEARDVDVQDMTGETFNAEYTAALDRRFREEWTAQQAYPRRVAAALVPGALLLNGGWPWAVLAGLSACGGVGDEIPPEQVFETRSGRVAIYGLDEQTDVETLIQAEGLPPGVRDTLEAVRGQRLAIVTLVTNPQAGPADQAPDPENKTLRLWDVQGEQEILTDLDPGGSVTALAFGPYGRRVAVATRPYVQGMDDYPIILWDLTTDTPIIQLERDQSAAGALIFSPDGDELIVRAYGRLEFWDLVTGTRTDQIYDGRWGWPEAMTLSSDGRFLALDLYGTQVAVVDTVTQEQVTILGENSDRQCDQFVDFAPDGQLMALADDCERQVQLWDTTTWTLQTRLATSDRPAGIAFSPHGGQLATVDRQGDVRIWDLAQQKVIHDLAMPVSQETYPLSIGFSSGGRTLSVVGDSGVYVGEPAFDQTLQAWPIVSHLGLGTAHTAAHAPDGRRVALGYQRQTSRQEAETGLRLSWTSTLVPDADGQQVHRYPLGTGQAWAKPIPLTRVYVVAAPELGFEAQAPRLGQDYSGYEGQGWFGGYPVQRIYDAQDQAAYAIDEVVTPEGQLWRAIYTQANPAEDVVVTLRAPLSLSPHHRYRAAVEWGGIASLGAGLALWLLAWRYLVGHLAGVRYVWLGKALWRDSLYWLLVGPVVSVAFLPSLIGAFWSWLAFAFRLSLCSVLALPLGLAAYALLALRFSRRGPGSLPLTDTKKAGSKPRRRFRPRVFWGFLGLLVGISGIYGALAYVTAVYLGAI